MSDYCLNIVREHDPDRFLLSLFAPRNKRSALWALFAFNYEIAKTRDVVSDTTIGLIRLQWWRDSIAEIYEGTSVRQHEIVEPLAQIIKEYDLSRELFDKLIYAREFDLEGVIPANIEGLFHYCEQTSAPLFKLALKIIGEANNDTAVVDTSVRYALVGSVRAVPYMLKSAQIMLPQDILDKHKLSKEKLFNFKGQDSLSQVIKEVLAARTPFRNDQSSKKEGELPSKFLKRVAHMSALYEAQIKSVDFDVFNPKISVPPRFMELRLWLGI